MPDRSSSRGKGKEDLNQIAFRVVQQATGQLPKEEPPPEKNPAAFTLGRQTKRANSASDLSGPGRRWTPSWFALGWLATAMRSPHTSS